MACRGTSAHRYTGRSPDAQDSLYVTLVRYLVGVAPSRARTSEHRTVGETSTTWSMFSRACTAVDAEVDKELRSRHHPLLPTASSQTSMRSGTFSSRLRPRRLFWLSCSRWQIWR